MKIDLLDRLADERERADDITYLLDEAIAEIEKLRAVADQARHMRVVQKAYFKERTQANLKTSKIAEKALDDLIARFYAPGTAASAQKTLL